MTSTRGARWHTRYVLLLVAVASSACSSAVEDKKRAALEAGAPHQGRDSGAGEFPDARPDVTPTVRSDAALCAEHDKAYRDFAPSHRACRADADCVVIGDCGPHGFDAVRADAATEAARLQSTLCTWTWDGPLYDAVCSAGTCTLRETPNRYCGILVPPEAGLDATVSPNRDQ